MLGLLLLQEIPCETVDTGLGGLGHCLKVMRAPKSLMVGAERCLGFGRGSLWLRVPCSEHGDEDGAV